MRFSIMTKITVLCGIFPLIFIPSILLLVMNLTQIVKTFKSVIHTSENIIAESHNLAKLVVDMETGQRGFIITGKDEFLEPFNEANEKFDNILKNLRKDLASRPKYLNMLEKMEHLRYKWIGIAGQPEIEARRSVNETVVSLKTINDTILAGKGKQIIDKNRVVISIMSNDFKKAHRKDELILITQIGKDLVDSETGERGFLLAGKDRFLEPYYAGQIAFSKHTKELEKILQGDKPNLERLVEVRKLYEEWIVKAARPEINARVVYEKNPRSMDDIASLLAAGAGKKIIDEFRKLIDEFTDSLTKDIKQELSQSERRVTSANFDSMTASCGGILLSIIFAFILGKSIISPIKVLTDGANIIGSGDLDHKIKLKSKDELGVLADSFNEMTENLRETTVSKDYTDNIITSMLDSLVVIDPDAKIRTVNKTTCDLLGYKEEELIGKDVSLLFPEEERTFIGTKLQKLFKEGSIMNYEVNFRTKDGNKIPVLLSGAVIRDKNGDVTNMVCVAKDNTERKRAEEELKKAKEKSEIANMAKSEFLANMSHEIRTPMNGILGFTDLLLEEELTEEHRSATQAIKTSGEGLLSLINDILDLSKIESKKIEIESIPFNVESLMFDVGELVRTNLGENPVEINCQIGDIETNLIGDPTRLRQIITNLTGNAIKFTHEGEIIIGVTTEKENEEEVTLKFYIRDTGIGIPEDKLKTIFESFAQADGSTTRKYGGSGLGLTISKKFAQLMGGDLWAESPAAGNPPLNHSTKTPAVFFISPLYLKKTLNLRSSLRL